MKIRFFAPLLLLLSCSDNSEKSKIISDSIKKDSSQKSSSDSSLKKNIVKWPQELPVDIQALKKQYGNGYLLSSVVSNSKLNVNCGNDSVKGFFGEYYFVDSVSMKDFKIKNILTVFKPGKPEKWRVEGTDERFVSITLKTPFIKLWDSLHVGMPVKNFPSNLLVQPNPERNSSGTLCDVSYKEKDGLITEIFVELPCEAATSVKK